MTRRNVNSRGWTPPLQGLAEDVEDLLNRTDSAETDITALAADVAALEAADVSLDGRLDSAEGDIDALQASDTSLDSRLDTLEAGAVMTTGAQTVAGVKTFSSAPVVPGISTSGTVAFSGTGLNVITSATVVTAGLDDVGLEVRVAGNLDVTTAYAGNNDAILKLTHNNGSTETFRFNSSGRIWCKAGVNNGSPGFYFTTPTGGKVLFRLTGGSGEIVQLRGDGGVTRFMIGGGNTSASVEIGPSDTELVITSSAVTLGTALVKAGNAAVTAFAGGGQANATALTKDVNFVTTVASAGDSVKLPTAALGKVVTVFNDGANSVNIYPATGAAIDALGTNNPYALAAGSSREFFGKSATVWKSR